MHEILTEKSFERTANGKKAAAKIVKFTNFSNEDFTHTWNSVPYKFPMGQFRFMDKNLADHFAKHLVNRELLKLGRENDTSPKKPEENIFFMELYNKAIEPVDTGATTDATALESEVIDRQTRAELGLEPATAPITVAPKASATAPATEEEFELIEGDDDEETE